MNNVAGKEEKVYQVVSQGYAWHYDKEAELLMQYRGLIRALSEKDDVASLLNVLASVRGLAMETEEGIKKSMKNIRWFLSDAGFGAGE